MPEHLIVFSHLRWDFVHQRPQHLLSRMAATHPVVYIEEPVHSEEVAHFEESSPAPGVVVLRPHTPVREAGYHPDQIRVIEPLLVEYLRAHGIEETLAWFYTPMALPLLRAIDPVVVVYDCMDELASFKGAPQGMRQQELALMKRADVVFTGGISLYEAKRTLHPNVHCQPSAVDVDHFAPSKLDGFSPHAGQALTLQGHLGRPRLGYFGVIDERMDLKLVASLAHAHPQWNIVMVGPVAKVDPAALPRLENIHWLGPQPYARLPYLVRDWDVCLMPFALNDATQYISPTKTLEYLAAEKPVVSTAVRDVIALYGEVVHIASNELDFIELCEAVLASSQPANLLGSGDARHGLSHFSWRATAQAMLSLIHHAMRKKLAALNPHQQDFEEVWSLSELPAGGVAPEVQMLSRGFKLG